MKRIIIAAPASGSGKTTVTVGIMAALKRRGIKVAPFKVGPDFIDPGYHQAATGTVSVNLDSWICGADFVRASFSRHAAGCDVAVIEGVMGLFDGIGGSCEAGSTAEVAKLLGAPVILVLDARSQARSAAALLHGFASFDPQVQIAGVIFNNVASANHERILCEAVGAALPGIAVIGSLPRDPGLAIPSRHLGLCTVEDNPLSEEFLSHLADVMEEHLDLERLLALPSRSGQPQRLHRGDRVSAIKPRFCRRGTSGSAVEKRRRKYRHCCRKARTNEELAAGKNVLRPADACKTLPFPGKKAPLPLQGKERGRGVRLVGAGEAPVRIAVARDAAFCFVYQDNLRLLEEQGAELIFFSPLAAQALPDGISGIYFPGGYPELFAGRLAANVELKGAVQGAVESGMPVYAECGGFVYLTSAVEAGGVKHPLVGTFPVATSMLPRRKALGYRQVELLEDSIIGRKGTIARGHEFHYSEMAAMPEGVERMYRVTRQGINIGEEGFRYKNCLASYVHLHFGSSPHIAATFVGHCRAFATRSLT